MGKLAHEQISELQLNSLLDGILPAVRETWGGESVAQIVAATNGELTGAPFNDIVRLRRVSWCSLGLNWELSWDSEAVSDALAEEFAALAQIALTDLTSIELFVPPTSVELTLRTGSAWDVESVADNDRSRFVIRIPAARKQGDIGRTQAEAIAVLAYVLGTVSLAPTESILSAIEESYKAGLPTKAFMGRSHTSLFTDFYDTGRLKAWKILSHSYSPPAVSIECVPELAWRDDLLASYNRTEHEAVIKKRYFKSRLSIRFTLERLNLFPEWQTIRQALSDEGWLDWHVLTALAMLVANWRINRNPVNRLTLASDPEAHFRQLMANEKPDAPQIPMTELTIKNLHRNLQMSMLSTAKAIGLEVKAQTPNLAACQKFLWTRARYGYDDVAHPDPFRNESLTDDAQWQELSLEDAE